MATIKYKENGEWVELSIGGGGGGSITLDSEMSDTSTNAVSNKVIKEYVDNAVTNSGGGTGGGGVDYCILDVSTTEKAIESFNQIMAKIEQGGVFDVYWYIQGSFMRVAGVMRFTSKTIMVNIDQGATLRTFQLKSDGTWTPYITQGLVRLMTSSSANEDNAAIAMSFMSNVPTALQIEDSDKQGVYQVLSMVSGAGGAVNLIAMDEDGMPIKYSLSMDGTLIRIN